MKDIKRRQLRHHIDIENRRQPEASDFQIDSDPNYNFQGNETI